MSGLLSKLRSWIPKGTNSRPAAQPFPLRTRLNIDTLENRVVMSANAVDPVLMVISNQDFSYQDYADTRASLEAAGLEVVVAATTTETSNPQWNSGQATDSGIVEPDLSLSAVEADDYSAIVFSGGWGMAQYQYGFEGTYNNSAYNGFTDSKTEVNDLINDFVEQDKYVTAVCYGVSVLAYARVDGESPLDGHTVTGWNGFAPAAETQESSRAQIESRAATRLASGLIGDPTTATDDVIVDGNIITAENYDSAYLLGGSIAQDLIVVK